MLQLSKNIIKQVRSLQERKFRRAEGLFIAESDKLVLDNLDTLSCQRLIATPEWWQAHPEAQQKAAECYIEADLSRISLLQHPQRVMGVFRIPDYELCPADLSDELVLALDTVQDPGNLGTIIRLSDWFGIHHIICTRETADCYSPKVVQATMGAIARVKVHYTDLALFLQSMRQAGAPIYGTYLDGDDLYHTTLTPTGVIIMGNEGNGISPAITPWVTHRLRIPSYPLGVATSESLNVGIATAITVAEFRRRM